MTKYQLRFMEAYHKETLGKTMAHAFRYHKYTQEEVSAYNQVNLIQHSLGITITVNTVITCMSLKMFISL